jgi:hypothetical protein
MTLTWSIPPRPWRNFERRPWPLISGISAGGVASGLRDL